MYRKKLSLVCFLILSVSTLSSQELISISGKITDGFDPVTDVSITVLETNDKFENDENGNYKLKAVPNQTLIFHKNGWIDQKVILEDISRIINIKMYPDAEVLEEVVVEKTREEKLVDKHREYLNNKDMIKMGMRILDKRKLGYSMQVFQGDELELFNADFISAIQTRVPGLNVVSDPNDPGTRKAFFTRNRGVFAIFDVDGVVFEEVPEFISSNDIFRIAVIRSSGLMNRYGPKGSGGVIIINTKNGSIFFEPGTQKSYDFSKIRGNFFKETDVKNFSNSIPPYIIELEQAPNPKEAYSIYKQQSRLRGSSAYYLLDVAQVFWSKWEDMKIVNEILYQVYKQFSTNTEILKSLAYTYEKIGEYDKALDTYKTILKLRPRYGQSYRDLANAYVQSGNINHGISMYSRYITSRRLDTISLLGEGIDSIIKSEFQNTLVLHSNEVNKSLNALINSFCCTRVLFEWNNSEAEFDLQIVTPENQYYVWSHTYEKNNELINNEKNKGYSVKEIVIDNYFVGEWLVNLKYFGNKSFDPTYLKATIYYNYGKTYQKQKSYYYKLTDKNINQSLLSIINNPLYLKEN